jgi:uncharacterized protein YidB (DUF937 family)
MGVDGSIEASSERNDGKLVRSNPSSASRGRSSRKSQRNGRTGGLVQAFQKNGLGELVNLWVSAGPNLPATPSHIQQGLGGNLLSQSAGKTGLSSGATSSQLAGLLPDLIDKLTLNGKIEAGELDQLTKLVQGKLGV